MGQCSMIVVIGPTEQDPGAPPLKPRLLKFDGCQGGDFTAVRSRDPDRIPAFLLKAPAAAVCATLAATDGDIHSFPETDTIVQIYSQTMNLLDPRGALLAGALGDMHVIEISNCELQFDNAASWLREGQHGLNVTDSVQSLYDRATNGFELGSVEALHAHVRESMQSQLEAFATEIAEADALNSRADVALDGARAEGKFPGFLAVLYEPPADTIARLHDPVEVHFRVDNQFDVSPRRSGRDDDRDGVERDTLDLSTHRQRGGPSETLTKEY